MSHLVICSACNTTLAMSSRKHYSQSSIVNVALLLEKLKGRCSGCNTRLTINGFALEIARVTRARSDTIARITLRLSVGLPPLPEKEMDISEFSGSLSHLFKHKTRSIDIIEDLDDKAYKNEHSIL